MISGGYPTSSALIRTDNMLLFRVVVLHIPAEVRKKGVWDTGEEINSPILQLLVEDIRRQEITNLLRDGCLWLGGDERT